MQITPFLKPHWPPPPHLVAVNAHHMGKLRNFTTIGTESSSKRRFSSSWMWKKQEKKTTKTEKEGKVYRSTFYFGLYFFVPLFFSGEGWFAQVTVCASSVEVQWLNVSVYWLKKLTPGECIVWWWRLTYTPQCPKRTRIRGTREDQTMGTKSTKTA